MIKLNVIHTRNLTQALNLKKNLKKVRRVITFHQKAWLKPYIDYWYEYQAKKKSKIWLWERFFQADEKFSFW